MTDSDFFPSAEEFQRAVYISTGQMLDSYVVHTVFELFDKDGEIRSIYSLAAWLIKKGRTNPLDWRRNVKCMAYGLL